ncbi:MAG: hypothetical protein J3K34DRAFT_245514 [Monoraphidium minutum]|nr:MAG: hypothetical protein J3K34DRAFT_245514 [Monoraphidium minutum]
MAGISCAPRRACAHQCVRGQQGGRARGCKSVGTNGHVWLGAAGCVRGRDAALAPLREAEPTEAAARASRVVMAGISCVPRRACAHQCVRGQQGGRARGCKSVGTNGHVWLGAAGCVRGRDAALAPLREAEPTEAAARAERRAPRASAHASGAAQGCERGHARRRARACQAVQSGLGFQCKGSRGTGRVRRRRRRPHEGAARGVHMVHRVYCVHVSAGYAGPAPRPAHAPRKAAGCRAGAGALRARGVRVLRSGTGGPKAGNE